MSEYSTPEQRTEMPTDRRMSQLRREGLIFISYDLASVASLLAGFYMLRVMWSYFYSDLKSVMVGSFKRIGEIKPYTTLDLHEIFLNLVVRIGPHILTMVVVIAAVASLAVLLQSKWNIKERKIEFKFNLLNPMAGIKRIISIGGFVQTLKAVAKLCLILPIGYFALQGYSTQMVMLMHTSITEVMVFSAVAMGKIFWKIMYVLIALAIFDYFWGRFQWMKNYKMTKDEVKDERKSIEGDEETRRRIIWKGIQRVMQRIKQGVKQADVVITNPTHYAVALKYDRTSMNAPTVVAKGRGHMAKRIRELAKESGIPVLERKMLTRAIYKSVEVGAEIPYELFKAVAEVLAYVYRLKRPHWKSPQSAANQAPA